MKKKITHTLIRIEIEIGNNILHNWWKNGNRN